MLRRVAIGASSDYRVRATTNDIQRLDKFARKGVRVTEADTLGRKDWFARMGILSRFEDPDAHYVIEDGILKLRIDRDLPRRRKPSASAVPFPVLGCQL